MLPKVKNQEQRFTNRKPKIFNDYRWRQALFVLLYLKTKTKISNKNHLNNQKFGAKPNVSPPGALSPNEEN